MERHLLLKVLLQWAILVTLLSKFLRMERPLTIQASYMAPPHLILTVTL